MNNHPSPTFIESKLPLIEHERLVELVQLMLRGQSKCETFTNAPDTLKDAYIDFIADENDELNRTYVICLSYFSFRYSDAQRLIDRLSQINKIEANLLVVLTCKVRKRELDYLLVEAKQLGFSKIELWSKNYFEEAVKEESCNGIIYGYLEKFHFPMIPGVSPTRLRRSAKNSVSVDPGQNINEIKAVIEVKDGRFIIKSSPLKIIRVENNKDVVLEAGPFEAWVDIDSGTWTSNFGYAIVNSGHQSSLGSNRAIALTMRQYLLEVHIIVKAEYIDYMQVMPSQDTNNSIVFIALKSIDFKTMLDDCSLNFHVRGNRSRTFCLPIKNQIDSNDHGRLSAADCLLDGGSLLDCLRCFIKVPNTSSVDSAGGI